MRRSSIAMLAALTLGACTPLTSNHPLFSVADQTGPAPLTEGVWVAIDENCTREMAAATPLPHGCEPLTLSRASDGGWTLTGLSKDADGGPKPQSVHFIAVPAVATARPDAYAPLYVVELSARDLDPHSDAPAEARIYGAAAPIGALPATELFFADIDCDAVLREGPIEGVTAERDGNGSLTGCLADRPAAVREAARRAMIEEVHTIDQSRLVFLHP
jgi:hypothetical protein